jgi:hypothetical protein
VVINKEMALQMTLRNTLRFDPGEIVNLQTRGANVRPVFGAEDERHFGRSAG